MIATLKLKAEYVGTPYPRRPVLFVTYGTPPYREMVERCYQSALAQDVEIHAELVPSAGSWDLNCHLKPAFLQRMRNEYTGRRLCWVDADAVFRAPPTWLDGLPDSVDVAAGKRKGWELLSGTVYLGAGPRVDALLRAWAVGCARDDQSNKATTWDQCLLERAILETPGIVYRPLPPAYVFIYDFFRREHPGVQPVIEHFQASRTLKNAT